MTSPEPCADTVGETPDTLLGGKVSLYQLRDGFRASVDSVLLGVVVGNALSRMKPRGRPALALEMGCGAGGALLCAAALAPEARFVALEITEEAAALAQHNLALNGMRDRVNIHQMDIRSAPDITARDTYDLTFFNPPYQDDPRQGRLPSPARRPAMVDDAGPLSDWIEIAFRTTRSGGTLALIHRADRLQTILSALNTHVGRIDVWPVAPNQGAPAHRVVVTARKGAKSPLLLHAPLILHQKSERAYAPFASDLLSGKSVPPVPRLR